MSFIKINDLIKIYNPTSKNSISALRGINLEIDKASFVTLVGPSGCGKSTLINLIGLFDKPTAGRITIEGISDIFKFKEKERIRYYQETIGYISQFSNHNLIPSWSVEDNIKIPLKLQNKLNNKEIDLRISDLLEMVNVKNRRKRQAKTLSGGESQRVSLAVALANNPKLLLADEPTGELDSNNTLIIADLLRTIVKEYGTTVLAVTHNHLFADKSDISWKMEDGRITELYKSVKSIAGKREHKKFHTVVDNQGNLRLPKEILEKSNIKNSVSIEYNETTKKVELDPK